jgi:hypothetical protein
LPITSASALRIEHFEQGSGSVIVLPHSFASHAMLADALGPIAENGTRSCISVRARTDGWGVWPPAILIAAGDSPTPLRALARLLLAANPSLHAETIARGGHTAPLTRLRALNAQVERFLDAGRPRVIHSLGWVLGVIYGLNYRVTHVLDPIFSLFIRDLQLWPVGDNTLRGG